MKPLTSDMVFFLLVLPAQEEINNNIVTEVCCTWQFVKNHNHNPQPRTIVLLVDLIMENLLQYLHVLKAKTVYIILSYHHVEALLFSRDRTCHLAIWLTHDHQLSSPAQGKITLSWNSETFCLLLPRVMVYYSSLWVCGKNFNFKQVMLRNQDFVR